MADHLTREQRVMAEEMLGVKKLDSVLEDVLGAGSQSPAVIQEMALEIINDHELVLSMRQWQTVQAMVEAGIQMGYLRGRRACQTACVSGV